MTTRQNSSTKRFKSPPSLVFKSNVEEAIIKSKEPLKTNESHQITANKEKGIWLNRCETCNWKGDLPLSEYPINQDPCPHLIKKKSKKIDQTQKIVVRYLKPATPPPPGAIIVRKEANKLTPAAPPIIIRQEPARACTPPPLIIREAPPPPPPPVPTKIITIPGRIIAPPPRKVIIEKIANEPAKPQTVIIERWLPYPKPKRKVIYEKAPEPIVCKPLPTIRNVVVQWEPSEVCLQPELQSLGVLHMDPFEYAARYSHLFRSYSDYPIDYNNLPSNNHHDSPEQAVNTTNNNSNNSNNSNNNNDNNNNNRSSSSSNNHNHHPHHHHHNNNNNNNNHNHHHRNKSCTPVHDLIGDIEALKLVDLDSEGLGMYKDVVNNFPDTNNHSHNNNNNNNNNNNTNNNVPAPFPYDPTGSKPCIYCVTTCNSPYDGFDYIDSIQTYPFF